MKRPEESEIEPALWEGLKMAIYQIAAELFMAEKRSGKPVILERNQVDQLASKADQYCHYSQKENWELRFKLKEWAATFKEEKLRPYLLDIVDAVYPPISTESKVELKGDLPSEEK